MDFIVLVNTFLQNILIPGKTVYKNAHSGITARKALIFNNVRDNALRWGANGHNTISDKIARRILRPGA
jgi:hypothetical protein